MDALFLMMLLFIYTIVFIVAVVFVSLGWIRIEDNRFFNYVSCSKSPSPKLCNHFPINIIPGAARKTFCTLTEGVFGFYGCTVLHVFRLGFSVSALKSIGFAFFNIATVNGFCVIRVGFLVCIAGMYGFRILKIQFSDEIFTKSIVITRCKRYDKQDNYRMHRTLIYCTGGF